MAEYMIYIWLGVILFALIVEGITAQLVSIWFVPGGLAGLIAGFCGAGEWIQVLTTAPISNCIHSPAAQENGYRC